jgi:hypothetical protein
MENYLKIKLKTQNGVNVIIGAEKYFDIAFLSYEIMNPNVVSNEIVELQVDDSIIVKNLDLIAKTFFYFYNNPNPVTRLLIIEFQNSSFKILVKQIFQRFPLFEEFEITEIDYGFNLDNPVTRGEIELITSILFNNCSTNKSSYNYYASCKNNINSKSKCLNFSLNIVLSRELKQCLKIYRSKN